MSALARPRPRRLPTGAYIALALTLTGTLWALFAPHSSAGTTDANARAVAAGHELFLEGCASCHGLEAQGGATGPSLIGVGAAAANFQLTTGRMPLIQPAAEAPEHPVEYSAAQIADLSSYIASLAPGPAVPNTSGVATASVPQGEELFSANCAQCHNFAGAGGALAYGKYAPNLEYLPGGAHITATQIEEAMITGPENMPVFGPDQLSSTQRDQIAAYLLAIRHTGNPGGDSLGRLGPVPEGAVTWIAGIGAIVLATIWIGSKV